MVVKEAQRTYTYSDLFGYATDMVVCNRKRYDLMCTYTGDFDAWKETQARDRQAVEES